MGAAFRNNTQVRALIWCEQKKEKIMFRVSIIVIAALSLSACETAQGFGRDVENAGETLQEEAAS
jgi:predicted small secreted protein